MKKIFVLLVALLVGCQTGQNYPETIREGHEITDVKTALIGHWERIDDNWDVYITESTIISKRKSNGVEVLSKYEILSYDEENGTLEIKSVVDGVDTMYSVETYKFTDEKRVAIEFWGDIYEQGSNEKLTNDDSKVFKLRYVDDKTKQ